MAEYGIQIYHGSGKKPWVRSALVESDNFEDRAADGYPPRSHHCMPDETEFANSQKEAQLDLERREANAHKSRTMLMWRNALNSTWNNHPIEEVQKLFDRQPMIMREIIANGGARTRY